MVCLSRPYPFKFFNGSLPQFLLGPFLNTLSQMNSYLTGILMNCLFQAMLKQQMIHLGKKQQKIITKKNKNKIKLILEEVFTNILY